MVDEELHFKTILRRKNAAKARIYRKSVIDDKKSKRLKTAQKENGTFDKRCGNDSTALRIPLSELSPNILNDGRGIANVEVSRQLHSSLKTKPSTNNNIRSKKISSRNITKLGVNLSKRFDNTFAATTSNQDPIPELQLNELFASDSGDGNMNDESNGYSSATNSSFDEDEMSNGTDAMETFEITSGGYYDIGDPVIECQYCGANMWSKSGVDVNIVRKLSEMLYEHNVHAQSFRMARDILCEEGVSDLKLRLISERRNDGRIYNQPTVSEVTALIVGDVDTAEKRDIIVQKQCGELQRINEYHTSYLGYQYPLLFPYGEDGYRPNVRHRDKGTNIRHFTDITQSEQNNKNIPWEEATKRNRLTIREWLAFRIQSRSNEAQTLLRSRRLYQQFLVDGFTMMESERLRWLRKNQSKLRVGKYHNLNEYNSNGETHGSNTGKRVVLPSSYVGSSRYMDQLYFDGMAICSYVGFPDLFITFTCNPNWPEIQRSLGSVHLKASDRPDIISRVFKMKFDELLSDLTKKSLLGKVLAYMYTIEFQKRGLPHAHILIFLHPSNKYPTPSDIDRIISAKIPDQDTNEELYNLVKTHMIHGPCGFANRSSPCMKDGKCSKYFPKQFQPETIVDQDGFPVYRRRDNGHTVLKNGIQVDNRNVVPYNAKLLTKYQAHINMEWCNQSTSNKYLFKYINKGYDRITAAIVPNDDGTSNQPQNIDEIKQYIDCRYVSPSEASWRIFSFPIHGRKPAVERLYFHCEGQNSVYYTDFDRINTVLEKPSVTESMFTSWFEANCKYPEAQNLTYNKFVSKFVYVKKKREWKPRQKVNNVKYDTFRDACFAMGFIGDDREFIAAIKEANHWGSGSINKPRHVWSKTCHLLADGILYAQQRIANNRGLRLLDEEIMNLTLIEIERNLQRKSRSLKEFAGMPYPSGYVVEQLGNKLIYEERSYNPAEQLQEYNNLFFNLTVFCFEAFDKTLKDIMGRSNCSDKLLGGKVIVFGGDFRQILPVVPRGSRSDIIHSTINSSYIWDHCVVLKLTKNMRLQQAGNTSSTSELELFSNWILKVGDGKLEEPNDGYTDIPIPNDFLISNYDDPLEAIVSETYPNFLNNYRNPEFLQSRAILAGTIETIDIINQYVLEFIPGEEKEYLSSDSVDTFDGEGNEAFDVLTPEFLNTLTTSSLPNHKIKLKIGTPIMLLRNIDQPEGLCNGTRLIVTRLANHGNESSLSKRLRTGFV
ncbi:uncharacterized protein LOC127123389 [Lathyrus oleraceus]|uniref:uncharacterized protein LOC127123389 n=1 Tax=Pisum sativum TaxID=3888 RepID=UPI0021D0DB1F|nr:uncharacterized protein LOC127123389 [Pisum sativum]